MVVWYKCLGIVIASLPLMFKIYTPFTQASRCKWLVWQSYCFWSQKLFVYAHVDEGSTINCILISLTIMVMINQELPFLSHWFTVATKDRSGCFVPVDLTWQREFVNKVFSGKWKLSHCEPVVTVAPVSVYHGAQIAQGCPSPHADLPV